MEISMDKHYYWLKEAKKCLRRRWKNLAKDGNPHCIFCAITKRCTYNTCPNKILYDNEFEKIEHKKLSNNLECHSPKQGERYIIGPSDKGFSGKIGEKITFNGNELTKAFKDLKHF